MPCWQFAIYDQLPRNTVANSDLEQYVVRSMGQSQAYRFLRLKTWEERHIKTRQDYDL